MQCNTTQYHAMQSKTIFWLCWGGGHGKWPKTAFFAKVPSPRHFCEENFFRASTIRKSTDSRFRLCGSHRGTDDQNYSYRSSKSGQVGKSGFVPENSGCHRKLPRAQKNFKSLFLLREVFKYHLKTSLRRIWYQIILKNCRSFLWHPFFTFVFLRIWLYFGGR